MKIKIDGCHRTLLVNGIVLNFDRGGGYVGVNISQNSLNHTFKMMCFIVWKLYFNKADLKK